MSAGAWRDSAARLRFSGKPCSLAELVQYSESRGIGSGGGMGGGGGGLLIAKIVEVEAAYSASWSALAVNSLLFIRAGGETQQRVAMTTNEESGSRLITVHLQTTDKYRIVHRGRTEGVSQTLRDVVLSGSCDELMVTMSDNPKVTLTAIPPDHPAGGTGVDAEGTRAYGPLRIVGLIEDKCYDCQSLDKNLQPVGCRLLLSANAPVTLDRVIGLHSQTPADLVKVLESLAAQRSINNNPPLNDIVLLSQPSKVTTDISRIRHACRLYPSQPQREVDAASNRPTRKIIPVTAPARANVIGPPPAWKPAPKPQPMTSFLINEPRSMTSSATSEHQPNIMTPSQSRNNSSVETDQSESVYALKKVFSQKLNLGSTSGSGTQPLAGVKFPKSFSSPSTFCAILNSVHATTETRQIPPQVPPFEERQDYEDVHGHGANMLNGQGSQEIYQNAEEAKATSSQSTGPAGGIQTRSSMERRNCSSSIGSNGSRVGSTCRSGSTGISNGISSGGGTVLENARRFGTDAVFHNMSGKQPAAVDDGPYLTAQSPKRSSSLPVTDAVKKIVARREVRSSETSAAAISKSSWEASSKTEGSFPQPASDPQIASASYYPSWTMKLNTKKDLPSPPTSPAQQSDEPVDDGGEYVDVGTGMSKSDGQQNEFNYSQAINQVGKDKKEKSVINPGFVTRTDSPQSWESNISSNDKNSNTGPESRLSTPYVQMQPKPGGTPVKPKLPVSARWGNGKQDSTGSAGSDKASGAVADDLEEDEGNYEKVDEDFWRVNASGLVRPTSVEELRREPLGFSRQRNASVTDSRSPMMTTPASVQQPKRSRTPFGSKSSKLVAVTSSPAAAEWKTLSDIPQNLSSLSVGDVGVVLRLLRMEKYKKEFEKQVIDGAMLKSLKKEHLETKGKNGFNMTQLDAHRLIEFANGWRPVV